MMHLVKLKFLKVFHIDEGQGVGGGGVVRGWGEGRAKTASLGIPNNVIHKLCLNCHLRLRQRFIRNSYISYDRAIHLLSGCQVSSSGYSMFSTSRKNDNVYFGSGHNWPILGGLGAITPQKNVRLS